MTVFSLAGEDLVRSSDEIRSACRENRRNLAFEVSGTVVIPNILPYSSFAVESDGRVTFFCDMRTNRTALATVGDRVVVSGRTEARKQGRGTAANCYDLRIVGNGPSPTGLPMKLGDFLANDTDEDRLLSLHGIVQDVFPDDIDAQYICVIFGDGTNTVNLICNCPRSHLIGFRPLLGCDVVVTGAASAGDRDGPRHLAPNLRIAGTNSFRIIRHPSGHPFNAPALKTDDIGNPQRLAALGPQRIFGTVLATWGQQSFLLRTPDGHPVRIDLIDSELPAVGSTVEAVGAAETDLCDITLSRAFWRPSDLPAAAEEPATELSLDDLFTYGRLRFASINVRTHGKKLSLRGSVKNVTQDDDGGQKVLLSDGNHTLQALCAPHISANLEEGSVVKVTGICVKDSDVWRPAVPIPRIRGLFLVVRSADDIVVLKAAPWWTPARFALVLTVLLAVLVAVFIWNASLRILIERRSREIIKAQTAKIESELRIDERTRLAAELHDNTVQNLTAIAYRITAAQCALKDQDGDVGRILKVVARMLKSCRTSLRRCLWDLRSDALDESDFSTAIRRTVETVAGDARLSIRFAGHRELISDTTAHAVLNILRELVSNATVHGQADTVAIAGEARPDSIRFSVKDNGTGFDPSARPGQDDGHFGLDGILERLERLGGTLTVDSSVGKGTYVRINILKQ